MATLTTSERITLYEDALDSLVSGDLIAQVTIGSVSRTYTRPSQIQSILTRLYAKYARENGRNVNYARFS